MFEIHQRREEKKKKIYNIYIDIDASCAVFCFWRFLKKILFRRLCIIIIIIVVSFAYWTYWQRRRRRRIDRSCKWWQRREWPAWRPAANARPGSFYIYTMPIRAGHVKWNRVRLGKRDSLFYFSFLFLIAYKH